MPKISEIQRLKETVQKMRRENGIQDKLIATLQVQLSKAALDYLTGLPNYNELTVERIRQIIHQAERMDNHTTVFYFDLDGLKIINDTYGHEAGDAALRQVVDSIKKELRATDYFVRKGGDEFALLMVTKKKPSDSELKHLIKRINKSVLENPLELDKKVITLSVSMGYKHYAYNSDFEKEFAVADGFLYKDKARKDKADRKK